MTTHRSPSLTSQSTSLSNVAPSRRTTTPWRLNTSPLTCIPYPRKPLMVFVMRLSQPSAAVVAWGNAWLTGNVGLDEAVDAVPGPQVISPTDQPLRVFLAELRSQGLTELRLALPVPGDPLGLTGPADLNAAALEAGEAVITDLGLGLVPEPDLRGSS